MPDLRCEDIRYAFPAPLSRRRTRVSEPGDESGRSDAGRAKSESDKWCPRCQRTLPTSAFAKNRARHDGLQTMCRECRRPLDKARYSAHGARMAQQSNASRANRQRDAHAATWAFLLEHPCVSCGETDPVVLELHHVRGEKETEVAVLLARCYEWTRIEAEIARCVVLCANCHRRETARQLNWWRARFSEREARSPET